MKNAAQIWIGSYLKQWLPLLLKGRKTKIRQAVLALADHYEPFWGQADESKALARLAAFEKGWPQVCGELKDRWGNRPQHTFFYPLEEYRPEILDRLARLCADGYGDVEVHLHHDGGESARLQDELSGFAEMLHQKHGLLRKDPQSGQLTYGFIHGNWALDNSRPDGRWCGINDELLVLKNSGCYADFTMPSAPDPAQTSTINSIYYAVDDPLGPKSHDKGVPAKVGGEPSGDLLLVQGVLALDWGHRKYGLLPHLENSDLAWYQLPQKRRISIWLDFAPVVEGAEDICFIKLHCHGGPRWNHVALLDVSMYNMLEYMLKRAPEDLGCEFRFATCWEMVQMIHALERGEGIG